MKYSLKILKAGNGDAILINFLGNDGIYHNILIDGGNKGSYSNNLKKELIEIIRREEVLDLVIVTHIDIDHIGGIIKMFDDIKDNQLYFKDENETKSFLIIKDVWFNANKLLTLNEFLMSPLSFKINESHGADLEMYLEKTDYWTKKLIARPNEYKNNLGIKEIFGAKITLLAPEKGFLTQYQEKIKKAWEAGRLKHQNKNHEISLPDSIQAENNKKTFEVLINELQDELDKGVKEDFDDTDANLSSIALIFKYDRKSILLLGDAPPQIITKSLTELGYTSKKPLKVDYVKLSHHGSIKSISYELLKLVDCKKFIISTNGKNHNLPNKKALAKIILAKGEGIEFYFNHSGENYNIDFYKEEVSNDDNEIDERDIFKFKTFFCEEETGYTI